MAFFMLQTIDRCKLNYKLKPIATSLYLIFFFYIYRFNIALTAKSLATEVGALRVPCQLI